MTTKRNELIRNLTQTISKESKRVNGGNEQLIEKLQKILEIKLSLMLKKLKKLKFKQNMMLLPI